MASGQQLSEQNLAIFKTWVASKTDAEFRAMVNRGVLSRKEIAKECGFAISVLSQNPRIRSLLKETEDGLRAGGILPPLVLPENGEAIDLPMRVRSNARAAAAADYVKRLETDNAALRAELSEVKHKLERYQLLDDALATTGRLLR